MSGNCDFVRPAMRLGLNDYPHRPIAHLRGISRGPSLLCHDSILSDDEASGPPGPVHSGRGGPSAGGSSVSGHQPHRHAAAPGRLLFPGERDPAARRTALTGLLAETMGEPPRAAPARSVASAGSRLSAKGLASRDRRRSVPLLARPARPVARLRDGQTGRGRRSELTTGPRPVFRSCRRAIS